MSFDERGGGPGWKEMELTIVSLCMVRSGFGGTYAYFSKPLNLSNTFTSVHTPIKFHNRVSPLTKPLLHTCIEFVDTYSERSRIRSKQKYFLSHRNENLLVVMIWNEMGKIHLTNEISFISAI